MIRRNATGTSENFERHGGAVLFRAGRVVSGRHDPERARLVCERLDRNGQHPRRGYTAVPGPSPIGPQMLGIDPQPKLGIRSSRDANCSARFASAVRRPDPAGNVQNSTNRAVNWLDAQPHSGAMARVQGPLERPKTSLPATFLTSPPLAHNSRPIRDLRRFSAI